MSGLIGTSSKTHLCPGLVLLPVSQVTAKYFLWVDDDFYFMNQHREVCGDHWVCARAGCGEFLINDHWRLVTGQSQRTNQPASHSGLNQVQFNSVRFSHSTDKNEKNAIKMEITVRERRMPLIKLKRTGTGPEPLLLHAGARGGRVSVPSADTTDRCPGLRTIDIYTHVYMSMLRTMC